MKKIKVGFFQFSPFYHEPLKNTFFILKNIENYEFDLLVLPELALSGYLFKNKEELKEVAKVVKGRSIDLFLNYSRQKNRTIVVGAPEIKDDKIFNSAFLISGGKIKAIYRKVHLFNLEKKLFNEGEEEFPVVDLGNYKIGLMICFDWLFPEVTRILMLKGASVIAHPSNLVLPYCQNVMLTRSLENRVFSITANRIGSENLGTVNLYFTGKSQIVSPKGEIIYRAGENEQEIIIREIDVNEAEDKWITERNNILKDRRPELYGKILS